MNKQETAEAIKVMQAFVDGATVEERTVHEEEFHKTGWTPYRTPHNPLFNFEEYEYRIKPKPREWWLDPTDGEVLQQETAPNSDFIKVREVL